MGVAGSGKSTIGPPLAAALGVHFVDGDDVHTDAAKEQMAAGVPLTDAERAPWLDRLHAVLANRAAEHEGVVIACSALTPDYRARLRGDLDDVIFLTLVAPPTVLETRLETRPHHFAGASLLPSQLDTLELGDGIVLIDGTQPVGTVTAAAAQAVRDSLR